jgi:hypothetical protein
MLLFYVGWEHEWYLHWIRFVIVKSTSTTVCLAIEIDHVACCSDLARMWKHQWSLGRDAAAMLIKLTVTKGAFEFFNHGWSDNAAVHLCLRNRSVVWMRLDHNIIRQPDRSWFSGQESLVASTNWFVCILCYIVTLDVFWEKELHNLCCELGFKWYIYSIFKHVSDNYYCVEFNVHCTIKFFLLVATHKYHMIFIEYFVHSIEDFGCP